ncbi:MAG: c-type cytochrome [Rhizobacter sp.]
MKRRLLATALAGLWLAALSGFAQAQPAASAPKADYAARFASVCAACHGAQGVSATALTPSLAAQPSFYAVTQIFLFRQGRRDNPAMAAIAKDMTDADMIGFAEHMSKLAPPPVAAAGTPVDAARYGRGEALAREHRCAACHGKEFAGDRQVPRLALQREDYLLLALRGFKEGKRVGYTQAMNEVLSGVAPEQLEDLAHYLSHIGVR